MKIEVLSKEELKYRIENKISLPRAFFERTLTDQLKLINLVPFMQWFDPDNLIFYNGSYRLKNDKSCCFKANICSDFEKHKTSIGYGFLQDHYGYGFYTAAYCFYCFYKSKTFINNNLDYEDEKPKITKNDISKMITDGTISTIDGKKNIYAYLLYNRRISIDTITYLKDNELIFSENGTSGVNILFPHYENYTDETVIDDMIGFELNGTLSYQDKRYKKVQSSEKYSSFVISEGVDENEIKNIYIFESAIDLISFYDLYQNNLIDIPDYNWIFISMRGLNKKILDKYLKSGDKIYSCVDSDVAGRRFNSELYEKINNELYTIYDYLKNHNYKDINDLLKDKENIRYTIPFDDLFKDESDLAW